MQYPLYCDHWAFVIEMTSLDNSVLKFFYKHQSRYIAALASIFDTYMYVGDHVMHVVTKAVFTAARKVVVHQTVVRMPSMNVTFN